MLDRVSHKPHTRHQLTVVVGFPPIVGEGLRISEVNGSPPPDRVPCGGVKSGGADGVIEWIVEPVGFPHMGLDDRVEETRTIPSGLESVRRLLVARKHQLQWHGGVGHRLVV